MQLIRPNAIQRRDPAAEDMIAAAVARHLAPRAYGWVPARCASPDIAAYEKAKPRAAQYSAPLGGANFEWKMPTGAASARSTTARAGGCLLTFARRVAFGLLRQS